jgi:soluble lytic murein transglycosylase
MTSNAHRTALLAALENNDPSYADAYLGKYSKQMNADDILAVRGHITKDMDARVGMDIASEVMGKMQPRIQVGEAERAFNILIGTESGGDQFDSNGQPLTSTAGAIGIAQVMPETAKEAAKLAGLQWDENQYRTDANYNKALGLAYFQKQLQSTGGNLAKAYAAYNAGPGALKEAERAGPDWLAALPRETQDYVAKNMRAFNSGQGQPSRPTFQEIDDHLRADPRIASNPGRYKIAREEASRQFEEQTKAIKQREDEGTANAMRAVMQNGGRFADLPSDAQLLNAYWNMEIARR